MSTDGRDDRDPEIERSEAKSSDCSLTPSTESAESFGGEPPEPRIGLMSWVPKEGVAKWSVRAFCFIQAIHCMTVIVCEPTAAAARGSHTAARVGVMFGHTFQLGLLLFALAVVQLGDALLQRIALLAIFETFLAATVMFWLSPAGYEASPWHSALGVLDCSVLCSLGLALLLDCMGGWATKQ
jgi:hypothetical protein